MECCPNDSDSDGYAYTHSVIHLYVVQRDRWSTELARPNAEHADTEMIMRLLHTDGQHGDPPVY